MMTLALRMGRTVGELMETMTAAELMLWRAFDAESPLGDARGDIQAALVAASMFQAQGGKVSLADVLPRWQADPEPEETGWSGFVEAMRTFDGKC